MGRSRSRLFPDWVRRQITRQVPCRRARCTAAAASSRRGCPARGASRARAWPARRPDGRSATAVSMVGGGVVALGSRREKPQSAGTRVTGFVVTLLFRSKRCSFFDNTVPSILALLLQRQCRPAPEGFYCLANHKPDGFHKEYQTDSPVSGS